MLNILAEEEERPEMQYLSPALECLVASQVIAIIIIGIVTLWSVPPTIS